MRGFIIGRLYVKRNSSCVTVAQYILMATSMFLGSTNSMVLSGRLDVEAGSYKFKIAAA
jgi:hypothetical protein